MSGSARAAKVKAHALRPQAARIQRCSADGDCQVEAWNLLAPRGFEATWNGGPGAEDISVRVDGSSEDPPFVQSTEGGVLTLHAGYQVQVEGEHALWLRGPINHPKDGLSPRERVVDASVLPCTVAFEWQITRPNHPVRFEEGEPFGTIVLHPEHRSGEPAMEVVGLPESLAEYEKIFAELEGDQEAEDEPPSLRDPARPVEMTLAVCTWNRGARLRRLLESVAATAPPPVGWEVIVIDNNSTDATADVAAELAARLPLRYVFEPRQGSAPARNRALTEARGDLVVFVDDDTTLDPGFLRAYVAAASAHPATSLFGGSIQVRFEEPEPGWVHFDPHSFARVYGQLDLDPRHVSVKADQRLPYGANFAVRRSRVGADRFDEALGVVGRRRINGEESLFLWRLLQRGEQGRWLPEARVYHWIPPELTTPRHFVHYFVAMGRGLAYLRRVGLVLAHLAAEPSPREAAKTAASHLLLAGIHRALDVPSWVEHLRRGSVAFGELQEIVSSRWSRRAPGETGSSG